MNGDPSTLAEELLAARRGARLLSAPQTLSFADAYAVADRVYRLRSKDGEIGVGRKIGFTNARMWAQYGADGPLWGHVYDGTLRYLAGEPHFDLAGTVQPKIEPEIVFRLREVPRKDCSIPEVLACIDWVAHGFEIVDSHLTGWRFTPPQAVADFGLHHALLVGTRVPLHELRDAAHALTAFEIDLLCDGEVRDQGGGASVLGNPLKAIAYLVNALADAPHLLPLQAGEVITTGTLTAALPVKAGETWTTRMRGIGLRPMQVEFG